MKDEVTLDLGMENFNHDFIITIGYDSRNQTASVRFTPFLERELPKEIQKSPAGASPSTSNSASSARLCGDFRNY
jgi:hypothetical protein